MDNSSYAFEFVKGATVPMIIGNAAAVGVAIIIVTLLSHERFTRKKGTECISNTFQRWLLLCIVVAYLVTSTFTFILQNGMVKIETQEIFSSAINDVEVDINGKSDAQLLNIAKQVKLDYETNSEISLQELANKHEIIEINVVDANGIIINSTESDVIGTYDMNSKEQSKEFVDVLKTQDSFVQKYSRRGKDETVWRKYAAMKLDDGVFIQVG